MSRFIAMLWAGKWQSIFAMTVLVVGFLVSTHLSARVANMVELAMKRELNQHFAEIQNAIENRVIQYVQGLRGARGLFITNDTVDADKFSLYVRTRKLDEEFPGALGFGFIDRVSRNNVENYLETIRAIVRKDFTIRTSGSAPDLYVIRFIEPLARNRAASGFDVGSEHRRRAAAERAMVSGEPALTAPLSLLQDDREHRGFLLFLPVYAGGLTPETAEEREEKLIGWTYAPLVIDDLLGGISPSVRKQVAFELYVGNLAEESFLLYDSQRTTADSTAEPESLAELATAKPGFDYAQHSSDHVLRNLDYMQAYGANWTLKFSRLADTRSKFDQAAAPTVMIVGCLLSVLSAVTFWLLGSSRERAVELAHAMTADLRESEQQTMKARQRAEQSLNELQVHQLAMNWHNLVTIFDLNRRFTYVNDRFCNMSGYRRDQLIGQVYYLVASDQHDDDFWRDLWETAEAGAVWQGEICHCSRHGDLYWVSTTVVPYRNTAGQITGFFAFQTDISSLKNAEQELATARLRLQSVLDSATEVSIVATDTRGLITLFSRGAEKLLGYAADEMVGKQTPAVLHDPVEMAHRARELTHELGRPIEGFEVFVAVAQEQGSETREWGYFCKNGQRKEVSLSVTTLWNEAGSLVGYLGTALDISERKQAIETVRRAQELAESANQAKSQFLANTSHEIRTPLTSILGYAALLRDNHQTPDEGVAANLTVTREEIVETILTAGNHLLEIINDILDFSKIEANELLIEQIEIELPSMLSAVERLLRPRARERNIELEMNFGTPVPALIVSDPTRLRQMLLNLIGNAIKFTEQGGVVVTVSIGPPETTDLCSVAAVACGRHSAHPNGDLHRLRVDIRDSGIGMSETEVERLFRPFSQADAGVTRRFGGTGLGLTICRRLAQLMDGRLELLWTAPGEGSIFRLELPVRCRPELLLTAEQAPLPRINRAVPSERPNLPARILLVEDSAPNRRLIALHLTRAGAEVVQAENGRVALDLIRGSCYFAEEPIDSRAVTAGIELVITDMQMPELDGYTLARTLRQERYTFPIIALTAHAMSEERDRCLREGCTAFATKPLDPDLLIQICANALQQTKPENNRLPKPAAAKLPTPSADALPFDALSCDAQPCAVPARPAQNQPDALPAQIVSGNRQVFDLERSLTLVDGDEAFLRELVQEYLNLSDELLGNVRTACQQSNLRELSAATHLMRGNLALLGAHASVEAAARLEGLAKTQASAEIEGAYAELLRETEQLSSTLRAYLTQGSQPLLPYGQRENVTADTHSN